MYRLFQAVVAASFLFFGALSATAAGPEDYITIELKDGPVVIELASDVAPKHAERLRTLAQQGAYDNVVFHRVIPGFMAQTGDVAFGKQGGNGYDPRRTGTGGSDLPDLAAEFSRLAFARGVVGMARSQNPNSANSQFFIMFKDAPHLNGDYTVVGKVVSGLEFVDNIKLGDGPNGAVSNPDRMLKVTVGRN